MRKDMMYLKEKSQTQERQTKTQGILIEKWQNRTETEINHQSQNALLKIRSNQEQLQQLKQMIDEVDKEASEAQKKTKSCEKRVIELEVKVDNQERKEKIHIEEVEKYKRLMNKLDEQLHSNMEQIQKVIYDIDSRLKSLEDSDTLSSVVNSKRAEEQELKEKDSSGILESKAKSSHRTSLTVNVGSPASSEISAENNQFTEQQVEPINPLKRFRTNSIRSRPIDSILNLSVRNLKLLQSSPSTQAATSRKSPNSSDKKLYSQRFFRKSSYFDPEQVINEPISLEERKRIYYSRSDTDQIYEVDFNVLPRMLESNFNQDAQTPQFAHSKRSTSMIEQMLYSESGRRMHDSTLNSHRSQAHSPSLPQNRRIFSQVQRKVSSPLTKSSFHKEKYLDVGAATFGIQESFRRPARIQSVQIFNKNSEQTLRRYAKTDISFSNFSSEFQNSSIGANLSETTRNLNRLSMPSSQIKKVSEVPPDWTSDDIEKEENLMVFEPLREPSPVEEI